MTGDKIYGRPVYSDIAQADIEKTFNKRLGGMAERAMTTITLAGDNLTVQEHEDLLCRMAMDEVVKRPVMKSMKNLPADRVSKRRKKTKAARIARKRNRKA
jgi:hypothetical protein